MPPAKQTRKEPFISQSDTTILMTVEDLIHIAMGPPDDNRVNFKLLQNILLIFARQLRMLSTSVELRVSSLDMSDEGGRRGQRGRRGKSRGGKGGGGRSDSQRRTSGSSPESVAREKQRAITDGRDRRGRSQSRPEGGRRDLSDDDVGGGGRRKSRYDDEKGGSTKKSKADDDSNDDIDRRRRSRSVQGRREISDDDVGKSGKSRSGIGSRDEDRDGRRKSRADGGRKSTAHGGRDDDDEKRGRKSTAHGGRDDDDEKRGRKSTAYGGRDDDNEKSGRKSTAYGGRDDDDEKSGRRKSTYDDDDDEGGRRKSTYLGEKSKASMRDMEADYDQAGGRGGRAASTTFGDRRPSSVSASRAPARVGSIEVVTHSEFDLLREDVEELLRKTGPIPEPSMPDNRKLRKDLAAGAATLSDTMEVMQIAARVNASEKAISRISDMITRLAASGNIPADIERPPSPEVTFKSEADIRDIEALDIDTPPTRRRSSLKGKGGVTRSDMEGYLSDMKDAISKNLSQAMQKATTVAEGANAVIKSVADKMVMASQLDSRLSGMHSMVQDYATQLEGFDTGVNIQIKCFYEQINQLREDLKGGLMLLEASQENAETAAVKELNDRFEGLMSDLDTAVTAQGQLLSQQRLLNDDLNSLLNAVDMLREQKADTEEVHDLLRDKADLSQLVGMVSAAEFADVRGNLENRLQACYNKFDMQQSTWITALADLKDVVSEKAELMQLLGLKEDASRDLNILKSRLDYLAEVLGEPKAAILTRQMAKDAACGVCRIPALMEIEDANASQPLALPAFYTRSAPRPAEEVCERDWEIRQPEDNREHICHRWAGGSHTVVGKHVTRERAGPLELGAGVRPMRKYEGLGDDDKYYLLEEELKPCEECNTILEKQNETKVPSLQLVDGAGDQGRRVTVVDVLGNEPVNRRMTILESPQSYYETHLESTAASRRATVVDESRRDSTAASRRATVVDESRRESTAASRRATVVDESRRESTAASRRATVVDESRRESTAASRRATVVDEPGPVNRRRMTVAPEMDLTSRRATAVDDNGLQEAASRRPTILKVEDEQARRVTITMEETEIKEPATRRVTMVDENVMQEEARKSNIAPPARGESEGNRKVTLVALPEGAGT